MANGFVTDGNEAALGVGQNNLPVTNLAIAQKFVMPGSGTFQADQIGLWGDGSGNTAEFIMAIYTHDSENDCPETIVANSGTGDMSVSGTGSSVEAENVYSTKPSLTGGVTYWICLVTKDSNLDVDDGVDVTSGETLSLAAGSYAWPADDDWHTHSDRTWNHSVYVIYSAAGGSAAPTGTLFGPFFGPLGGPI